jgi:hypothetical protein
MYGNRQGELDLDNALEFVEFKNVGSCADRYVELGS